MEKKDLAKVALTALLLASSLPTTSDAAEGELPEGIEGQALGTLLAAGCQAGSCGAEGGNGTNSRSGSYSLGTSNHIGTETNNNSSPMGTNRDAYSTGTSNNPYGTTNTFNRTPAVYSSNGANNSEATSGTYSGAGTPNANPSMNSGYQTFPGSNQSNAPEDSSTRQSD